MGLVLHKNSRSEGLAKDLAERLSVERTNAGDPFYQPRVLIPNAPVRTWLRRALATYSAQQIEMGTRFDFLDAGCWDICQVAHPEDHPNATRLTREILLWMILAILRAESLPAEMRRPFSDYLANDADWSQEDVARKYWQYADQLARLFLEYEQNDPVRMNAWRTTGNVTATPSPIATLQAAIYHAIFKPDGLRDALHSAGHAHCLTVPQRAALLFDSAGWAGRLPEAALHVFGAGSLTQWQVDFFARLASAIQVHVYLPEMGTLNGDRQSATLEQWRMVARLTEQKLLARDAQIETAPPPTFPASTLGNVQTRLLAQQPAETAADGSLQLFACPSIRREVEMVQDCILAAAETADAAIRLDDIGILVPNMDRYKPVIESVFGQHPQAHRINIIDATASEDSRYGEAVEALLDLADGRFTRREILTLAANPCFQHGCGLSPADAQDWTNWCVHLNIFHGFSATDKRVELVDPTNATHAASGATEQRSIRHTWQQGLRRLQLGRIMETATDYPGESVPGAGGLPNCFAGVMPYRDMASQDSDAVGRLAYVIHGLQQYRKRLGGAKTFLRWGKLLREMSSRFLATPDDLPLEGWVSDQLTAALADDVGALVDAAFTLAAKENPDRAAADESAHALPLTIMRQYVCESLGTIAAKRGEYLSGGVSFAALRAQRPVPFATLFILGLGQGEFPRRASASTLDLQRQEDAACDADALPSRADIDNYAFLEAVLSARERLVLSWVSRDLQTDETFFPGSTLTALCEYMSRHGLGELNPVHLPLHRSSVQYARDDATELPAQYDGMANLLRLKELAETGRLTAADATRVAAVIADKSRAEDFTPPESHVEDVASRSATMAIPLDDLARFLQNPAEAALRCLHIFDSDEEDDAAHEEDEPLALPPLLGGSIVNTIFTHQLATAAPNQSRKEKFSAAAIEENVRAVIAECRATSVLPEGAFGVFVENDLRAEVGDFLHRAATIFQKYAAPEWQYYPRLTIGAIPTDSGVPAGIISLSSPVFTVAANASSSEVTVTLSGSHDHLWVNQETGDIASLTSSPWSKISSSGLLPRQAQRAYLALAAATLAPNATDYTALTAARGTVFFELIAKNGAIRCYPFPAFQAAEIRAWLSDLIRDYVSLCENEAASNQPLTFLPIDKIGKPLKEMVDAPAEHFDAVAFYTEIESRVESARDRTYTAAVLDLIPNAVPKDVYAIALRRLTQLVPASNPAAKVSGKTKRNAKTP